jgi:hypothetical protein
MWYDPSDTPPWCTCPSRLAGHGPDCPVLDDDAVDDDDDTDDDTDDEESE